MEKILEIKNLKTSFDTFHGEVQAVRGVSFDLNRGEVIGIVGESGCGKSITMMSIMQLLDGNGKIKEGEIIFKGENITNIKESLMNTIRGNEISMIFQDPMTSLNLLLTIGDQITEPLIQHKKFSRVQAYEKGIELLNSVGIPAPKTRMNQYPHEFSGGMRQRAMIAMALACGPELLIADEPTTALDVTIQAQILDLMNNLKEKTDTSIILITHDLGVISSMCNRIVVMYGGTIVETGTTDEIFYSSKHPYTWGLLNSLPKVKGDKKEKLIPIPGSPPDLLHPPMGCPFTGRCQYAMKICKESLPNLKKISKTHSSACWMLHPSMPKKEVI